MKSAEKAKLSICKISYHYNNKTTLGTGFFMKYSDTLKLLITNYHVIYPELMNINFDLIVFVFGKVYIFRNYIKLYIRGKYYNYFYQIQNYLYYYFVLQA